MFLTLFGAMWKTYQANISRFILFHCSRGIKKIVFSVILVVFFLIKTFSYIKMKKGKKEKGKLVYI